MILIACLLCIAVACPYIVCARARLRTFPQKHCTNSRSHGISIHKTQIIKCDVSHRRIFPEKHAFRSSFLSVGIPVRSPTSSWLLSVDSRPWWDRGWFHVSPTDHLHRERSSRSLSAKLDAYLTQEVYIEVPRSQLYSALVADPSVIAQKLDPAAFPHVYLLTSPSFLHYYFSPASFWYLYDADIQLKYIIAEVNNTFDERRLYLFRAPQGLKVFRQTHQKDFHVSPFNSRKGSYELATTNPADGGHISITIALRSSKQRQKLVARWWSKELAIDSTDYSFPLSVWLLASWGWLVLVTCNVPLRKTLNSQISNTNTGLHTVPKIVFQAIILAQIRGLSIWYRPEPRETALARRVTPTEGFLASIFAQYLHHLLASLANDGSISVAYVSLDGLRRLPVLSHSARSQNLELRIHAPQFYRQMLTYGKLSDLLSCALLDAFEENRTAWSNDGERLIAALQALEIAEESSQKCEGQAGRTRVSGIFLPRLWAMHAWLGGFQQPLMGVYPAQGFPNRRAVVCPISSKNSADWPLRNQRHFLHEFVQNHVGCWLQIRFLIASLSIIWRSKLMAVIGGE